MNEAPVLEMEGERIPATVIRIGSECMPMIYELIQRLREVQSERFLVHTQEGSKMLTTKAMQAVDVVFNRLIAEKLINKFGMADVLRQIQAKLKADAEALKPQLEAIFNEGGNVDQSIEFLRTYVKGHIKFPWYVAIFGGGNKLVDAAFDYLKMNKDILKQGIGELAPVQ